MASSSAMRICITRPSVGRLVEQGACRTERRNSFTLLGFLRGQQARCALGARAIVRTAHTGKSQNPNPKAHRAAKNDGSGMSRIVLNPGAAVNTCGIAFTVIDAGAI